MKQKFLVFLVIMALSLISTPVLADGGDHTIWQTQVGGDSDTQGTTFDVSPLKGCIHVVIDWVSGNPDEAQAFIQTDSARYSREMLDFMPNPGYYDLLLNPNEFREKDANTGALLDAKYKGKGVQVGFHIYDPNRATVVKIYVIELLKCQGASKLIEHNNLVFTD